jgi:chromosomal replication initiation ATPase DnaA
MSPMEITPSISDQDRAAQSRRPVSGRYVSMRQLLIVTARLHGLPDDAILTHGRRTNRLARARRMAWWAARRVFPRLSTVRIGQLTGGYDHSTIIHGLAMCERDRSRDPAVRDLSHALLDCLGRSGVPA